MTVAEKRAKLKKELEKVKAEGLRVFINRSSDYYAYGLMTDGINIIYVQFSDYGIGFNTTFDYVPSRKNDSGCSTLKSGYEYKELSKEVFDEAVKIGKYLALYKYGAELYKSFEQYFRGKENNYIEL